MPFDSLEDIKLEVKKLIIQTLNFKNTRPEDILDSVSFFSGENTIKIDSIDSLELVLAIQKQFKVIFIDSLTEINELAKAWGQFEFLPEADHNTLAGTQFPSEMLTQSMTVFLKSPSDHPRNRLRIELPRDNFMVEGMGADVVEARGGHPLSHIWTSLYFGDFVAYYLALLYEVDPTPITVMENLKSALKTI
jgi:acyl carrier protein